MLQLGFPGANVLGLLGVVVPLQKGRCWWVGGAGVCTGGEG